MHVLFLSFSPQRRCFSRACF